MSEYAMEVGSGNRFNFGANWTQFLQGLDESRILQAENSLKEMLEVNTLTGKSFLDIGSGSGLFSLAARRLGARVYSFDYDPQSVACTAELKRRYFREDRNWVVEEASILNQKYLVSLGHFDVVYSWGVLHHIGAMWQALENVAPLVTRGGKLFISIYNDQGLASKIWLRIKKAYNRCPRGLRWLLLLPAFLRLWGPKIVLDLVRGKPFYTWYHYGEGSGRGMSPWRDVVDWVGGFPFEVAKPEAIFDFYRHRGFQLDRLQTCAGKHGCNQFVFTRLS
jgi:2-polyprenyl-6-hydroxyphenyl methylase/3-demethylubiquinone-9 3-methyltransferase